MSAGGTVLRERKVGARHVPLRFILKDGNGNIVDISALNVAVDFQIRFIELDDQDNEVSGTDFTGAGAFAFTTDGTDGGIEYSLTASDAAAVRRLQGELTVTFSTTTALPDIFPTPTRYILSFKKVI